MITSAERDRRKRLLETHMRFENAHDLDGIMGTFAPDALMDFNGQRFDTPDSIRAGHLLFGFGEQPGGLGGLTAVMERQHLTHDEIVVEGHVEGTHVGELLGLVPTGILVELPYIAFYRFDAGGKLVHERVTMDWALLNPVVRPTLEQSGGQ